MRKAKQTLAGAVIAGLVLAALSAGAQASNDGTPDNAAAFNFEHVSCNGGENEIRIVVTGVKKPVGLITADLFPNRQENFLRGRGRLKQVRFAAKAPTTRFCIEAPEPGQFAVSVYHDENANGDFDRGAFGLPAEPWGISRNPKVRFGPPGVEEAIFSVDPDGAAVEIRLN